MKVIGPKAMMYVAHPTRIWKSGGSNRIIEFVRKKGFAPVNPFPCGEFRDFEGGRVGRAGTLQWTLHLQRGCHWTGFCGVSDGTMRELEDRLKWDKEKRVRVFYEDDKGLLFDPKWEEEYKAFTDKYGDLLADLRGRNKLIAFVGPSAVGKTYWIERLTEKFGNRLRRVKNTTTRPPRDPHDERYYNRVSLEKFIEKSELNEFLEHDKYLDHHYGSSLLEMRRVLSGSHGIFAMTPSGALELNKARFEMNIELVVLRPTNKSVLLKNFDRRKERDYAKIMASLKKAADFKLPGHIQHKVLELTGTRFDEERVLNLINSILK